MKISFFCSKIFFSGQKKKKKKQIIERIKCKLPYCFLIGESNEILLNLIQISLYSFILNWWKFSGIIGQNIHWCFIKFIIVITKLLIINDYLFFQFFFFFFPLYHNLSRCIYFSFQKNVAKKKVIKKKKFSPQSIVTI